MENQETVMLEQPDNKGKIKKIMINGVITGNPLFRLVLALCPVVVVTAAALDALFMGIATLLVLALANLLSNLLGPFIDNKIRIPVFLVIISSLVIMVRLLFNFIEVRTGIPVYTPIKVAINLIVVNCVVFARIESFATKKNPETGKLENNALHSFLDGVFVGIGFLLALVIVGIVREIFGSGSVFGLSLHPIISPEEGALMPPIGVIGSLAGGFLALGIIIASFNQIYKVITRPKAPVKPGVTPEPVKTAEEVA